MHASVAAEISSRLAIKRYILEYCPLTVLPHYIDRLAMTCYMRYETVKRLHKIMHLFMNVTIQHKQIRYTYE